MAQSKGYVRGQPSSLYVPSVIEAEIELIVQALRESLNQPLERQEGRRKYLG